MELRNILFFWTTKTPTDNAWHPRPPGTPIPDEIIPPKPNNSLVDPAALCVDAAPFITGAGAFTHLRQWRDFGFTAQASVFRNPRTLRAMYLTTAIAMVAISAAQALRFEYRYFIPRWSQARERRREEAHVRQHVAWGMTAGCAITAFRIYRMVRLRQGRIGRKDFVKLAPVEVVMGGALADLLYREYVRAHNM